MKIKTSILMALILSVCATGAMAQMRQRKTDSTEPCQYTVLQNLVRDARDHERVFELIKAGVSMDDPTITCGGSLLQLAIRRGNPSIVNGILTQDKARANKPVSTVGFNMPGVPEKIPAVLFAAYYAPSEVVFNVLVDAGADVSVRDSQGRDILWYLARNPVLRRTQTEANIQATLQNKLLEQARQNATATPITPLPVVPDNTPKELSQPNLAESTLATP